MNAPETEDRRSSKLVDNLIEQLHNPVKLRFFVVGAVLAVGYFAVFSPMNEQIVQAQKQLKHDEKMLELAVSNEKLQKEYDEFKDRIPQNTDSKEWVQYMLDGIRKFPLKLVRLDCRAPKKVAPYKAIIIKVELEGEFPDMDNFIRWVESNQRLLRIDEISLAPSRGGENLTVLRMTVLGLTS